MNSSLNQKRSDKIISLLTESNTAFYKQYPGDSPHRQPVHTVYGGAQIFKADTARKLGATALQLLKDYAPNPSAFGKALGMKGTPAFHKLLYARIIEKLQREPVEDFRVDFEDGYGNRPDSEEDHHAEFTAGEVARGMKGNSLSPFIGIRLKPFTEELKARSIRTIDIFVTTLINQTDGKLPENFVVTLPKVVAPEQVHALVELFRQLESSLSLPAGSLKLEIMVETPQSIINSRGESALPILVAAGDGRCSSAPFGVYDYTASMTITAA